MRAAVLRAPDRPVSIEDVRVKDPGPGEVRVALRAAGLCHSDLSVIDGAIPYPTPVVLGHEGAGVVDAVGAGVTAVKEGDTVVLSTLAHCGRCPACEVGRPTSQAGQRPQWASVERTTVAPSFTAVTPGPTASTTPAPS